MIIGMHPSLEPRASERVSEGGTPGLVDAREGRMEALAHGHKLIGEPRVLRVKGADKDVGLAEEHQVQHRGFAHLCE